MPASVCGADCAQCPSKETCGGCRETGGHPFALECPIAVCCRSEGHEQCGQCSGTCKLKAPIMNEFNALGIPDMPEVTDLNMLLGSFVNLAYTLPNGQVVKLLEDDKCYFGNQLEKRGSSRCYGIVADETHLLAALTRRSSYTRNG